MNVTIRHRAPNATSYRAARVKSLFNCDDGESFALDAQLPIEDGGWRIGVVMGGSGTGKSSILRSVWPDVPIYSPPWSDRPIIDDIAPDAEFDAVPAALSAVGLGSVPAWLRPHGVLSLGEQFRANLARLVAESPARAKVDEFTSVVDRQIARVGALAFGKAWRRSSGQVILATCHRDVLDWLQPCWTFDTDTGEFARGLVRRRPTFELAIHETDWRYWSMFEPHHYLKLPKMIAAKCYVGSVDGQPVAHVAVSTRPGLTEARACRLVVMPEWQGAGVGMRFLNAVCERWRSGRNRFRRRMPVLFHTSHPGLADALRRDRRWVQVSAMLHGDDKLRSAASMQRSGSVPRGHGGHFRAVQGFRYYGEPRA